jgi:hypothetical protein
MAKGQQRSNREPKKPKKNKATKKQADKSFGSQIKNASARSDPLRKSKH